MAEKTCSVLELSMEKMVVLGQKGVYIWKKGACFWSGERIKRRGVWLVRRLEEFILFLMLAQPLGKKSTPG